MQLCSEISWTFLLCSPTQLFIDITELTTSRPIGPNEVYSYCFLKPEIPNT